MGINEIVLAETLARSAYEPTKIHATVVTLHTTTTPATADVRPYGDVAGRLSRVPYQAGLTLAVGDTVEIGRGVDARDLVIERSFGTP